MLVLSRRNQESVIVGDPHDLERRLIVTVIEIGRGKVKLGFAIPGDVPVHRSEVWERIRVRAVPETCAADASAPIM